MQLGVRAVRSLHAIVAIIGISVVCVCLVVIRADDPETAYDESETPVSVATPIVGTTVNSPLVSDARHPGADVGMEAESPRNPQVVKDTRGMIAVGIRLERLCKFLC